MKKTKLSPVVVKKFKYESELWDQGINLVAGVDEVGRGPLAGPVVAASVILPAEIPMNIPLRIDDSKKLTEKQRCDTYQWIIRYAVSWGVGIVGVEEIDKLNIRRAAIEAMKRSIAHLHVQPTHILVDGLPIDAPPFKQTAIVKGDSLSISIACASIIAKIIRDKIMTDHYDAIYPEYKFAKHKGYGTKAHVSAIKKLGYSPVHRKTFRIKSDSQEDLFNSKEANK